MRRRSTVGGALEMFSLPLPLPFCERGYTSLSIWGYSFLQLPAKDALVSALI